MEAISKRSKLLPARDTHAVNVAKTYVSFTDNNTQTVYPTTPPGPGVREFVFQILPSVSSELHPKSCKLITSVRLLKENGDAIDSTAQVGILNGFGATMWQSIEVRINGVLWLPEFGFSDHACYIKMLCAHSYRERHSLLNAVGWRTDTIGQTNSTKVELDPSCACICGKCPCVTKNDPTSGNSNCTPLTATEIDKLSDFSVAEIKANQQALVKFNQGLWIRAAMLKISRTSSVTVTTPLKFLHSFFDLCHYYPNRNTITVQLSLKEDKQILCVKDGEASSIKYRLDITDIKLHLKYATFEQRIRLKWFESLSGTGLVRNFQAPKVVHFCMKKTTRNCRYASIFNFSVVANYFSIWFLTEKAHMGNFALNRFSYQCPDLQAVRVYKSGVPLSCNSLTSDMTITKHSYHTSFWYQRFLEFFGEASYDITKECFFEDVFLLNWNMGANPLLSGDKAITLDHENRDLGPIDAGSIDVELEFRTALSENVNVYFCAWMDAEVAFDNNGIPMNL